jgi:hypothetical protein
MIPEDLYDECGWGVFTTHPRTLLSGKSLNTTLKEAGLYPRALLHVGELPYNPNAKGYSSSGSQGDAMDIDL